MVRQQIGQRALRATEGSGGAQKEGRDGKSAAPRLSGRQIKDRVLQRIQSDSDLVAASTSVVQPLRKHGYEELPVEEIQDRLSKLKTALAPFILSRRL